MIKRVKEFSPTTLIAQERSFLEKFESEILRGISTLVIMSIINDSGDDGIYGYKILKELEDKTNSILVIEDGTLYPILKKLNIDGIVIAEKKISGGRKRTYYKLTLKGLKIFHHIQGFFSKLIESIGPLLDIDVNLKHEKFIYCPNCANKIDINDDAVKYCEACGLNIEDLKRRLKNE
ncbi:MAG: PadR family transcriptional regulator [Candidatus Helarchaeota archaeon]